MRVSTSAGFSAAIVVTLLGIAAAAAQVSPPTPPEGFGHRGQTIVTTEAALDYQRDVLSMEGADDVSSSTYDVHVAFDRVLPSRLTLGARIGFEGYLAGLVHNKRFDLA